MKPIKNQMQYYRTIADVLSSEELHITFQKKCNDATLNGLPTENSIFNGYFPFGKLLSKTNIPEHPALKIYLHHKSKKNNETIDLKVCVGSLKKEKGKNYLNNTILLGDYNWIIEKWLRACYAHLVGTPKYLRNDPDFPLLENITELTQKDAEKLADIVIDHYRNGLPSERKSLEHIRETLGNDAFTQLKNEKRLMVKSSNGRNYIIDEYGEVSEDDSGKRCCVNVGGNLSKYDRILAKYLIIKDKPETIEVLELLKNELTPCEHYTNLFHIAISQHSEQIEQMGFQIGDFGICIDTKQSLWSMSISWIEDTIKGGKDFTLTGAHDTENNLTVELCDSIGANKLTPEFFHGAEYMNTALDYYLAYLEEYLAGSPEYVIMRNEKT